MGVLSDYRSVSFGSTIAPFVLFPLPPVPLPVACRVVTCIAFIGSRCIGGLGDYTTRSPGPSRPASVLNPNVVVTTSSSSFSSSATFLVGALLLFLLVVTGAPVVALPPSGTMKTTSKRRTTRSGTTALQLCAVVAASSSSSSARPPEGADHVVDEDRLCRRLLRDDHAEDGAWSGGGSGSSIPLPSFLSSWRCHDNADYHMFTAEEATAIRTDLMDWYNTSRRKLPWRGDPPPWSSRLEAAEEAKPTGERDGDDNNINEELVEERAQHAPARTANGRRRKRKRADITSSTTTPNEQDETSHKTYPVTPYGVWVSEVMLQQTRVDTVIKYWVAFMDSFPTVEHLANATSDQVNQRWAGLGYYRRAKMLHEAAKVVVKEYDGVLPTNSHGLLQLPGIGRYTANAIASICYDECVPVVDGNVCRVLSRLRGIAQTIKSPKLRDKHGWDLAGQIVRAGDGSRPGLVNQALMEVGASYCSPTGTGIHPHDPLRPYYLSTRLGQAVGEEMRKSRRMDGGWSTLGRTPSTTSPQCAVCAEGGVQQVLDSIRDALMTAAASKTREDDLGSDNLHEKFRIAGHRAFPLPPEPKVRREEVWAVAAISMSSSSCSSNGDKEPERQRWLMMQRPSTGLLASQWEFPSALLWSSADDDDLVAKGERSSAPPQTKIASKSRPPPANPKKGSPGGAGTAVVPRISASDRSGALDRLLYELGAAGTTMTVGASLPPLEAVPRVLLGGNEKDRNSAATKPLEHVFSHVRHTLWIEVGTTTMSEMDGGDLTYEPSSSSVPLEWNDGQNRRVRWMTTDEMVSVGVTACVTKILKRVDPEGGSVSSMSGTARTASSSSSSSSLASRASAPSGAPRSRKVSASPNKKKRSTGGRKEEPPLNKRSRRVEGRGARDQ